MRRHKTWLMTMLFDSRLAMWRGLTAADFADLRTKYTGRLSPQIMDTLERCITTEVYPRMKALQVAKVSEHPPQNLAEDVTKERDLQLDA